MEVKGITGPVESCVTLNACNVVKGRLHEGRGILKSSRINSSFTLVQKRHLSFLFFPFLFFFFF